VAVVIDAGADALQPAAAPSSHPEGLVRPRLVGHVRRDLPNVLRVVVPATLLLAWWWGSRAGWLEPSVLAPPGKVWDAFRDLAEGNLVEHLRTSLGRSLRGAAIGVSVGLALGLLSGLSRLGEQLVDATLQMLRTIPFLALVPLFIVWLGIGETPKVLLIALATLFPMYINTANGVLNVDRKVVEAMRTYGLSGVRLAREVILPLALPSILTGLRFSLGVSVLALLAAEQINASTGLGALLYQAQTYQRVDVLMVIVVIYALLGLLADGIVRVLERVTMPWRRGVAQR